MAASVHDILIAARLKYTQAQVCGPLVNCWIEGVLPAKVAVTEKLPAVAYVCVKVACPVALVVAVSELPSPYESVTVASASGGVPIALESIVTTKTAGSVAIGVSGSTVPLMDVEYLPISMVSTALDGKYCASPAMKCSSLPWSVMSIEQYYSSIVMVIGRLDDKILCLCQSHTHLCLEKPTTMHV